MRKFLVYKIPYITYAVKTIVMIEQNNGYIVQKTFDKKTKKSLGIKTFNIYSNTVIDILQI